MRQLRISQRITSRDSIALEQYFKDISKEHVITAEEEIVLAQRIKQGDVRALDKLIKANLRFVVSVSKQYEGYGIDLEDLISEGNIGLMKAARRFDASRGYKFISYAVFWIRQSILKSLNENARIIRLPSNQLAQVQKLHKVFTKLEQEFGREPSIEELCEEMELQPSEIDQLLMNSQLPLSIDKPIGEGEDGFTLEEKLKDKNVDDPDSKLMHESLSQELMRCLDKLNAREATVVRMHYGLDGGAPMKFNEIADSIGLGKERVRQIKVQAIRKLQSMNRRRNILPHP